MSAKKLSRSQIAWRVARDIEEGWYVNLGIGLPELVARFVPAGRRVIYRSENGVLGFSASPGSGEEDMDLVNAGKKPIGILPGTSFFHHADSFAMIRGGHIDLAILGAFQVASSGDIANWQAGDSAVPAVGGAMDLVAGARSVFVMSEHVTREGKPKLLERCTFPLTGVSVVKRVYTDLAVVDVTPAGFLLREKLSDISIEDLQDLTGARLLIEGLVGTLMAP